MGQLFASGGQSIGASASASALPMTIPGGSAYQLINPLAYEIKRHLLLGRKAMTNLDSILKSRDTTLPTKVHLIKALVFPVVMYGCESWTIKKAEK